MRTDELISVREYLHTSYRPDREYVDGKVVERNLGEKDHSKLQRAITTFFDNRRKQWNCRVFPEQRVQVSPTRFRVPDICVVVGPEPDGQIFTEPPFICIEILSPEDRLGAMQERVGDFLRMGVPYVFVVDPRTRRAHRVTAQGMLEVSELPTENPDMVVPLCDLFDE